MRTLMLSDVAGCVASACAKVWVRALAGTLGEDRCVVAELVQGQLPAAREQGLVKQGERERFYLRWFQVVPSRPSEGAIVLAFVQQALQTLLQHGRRAEAQVSVEEEEEILRRLEQACGEVQQAVPSEGELWDWASAHSAAFVAREARVSIEALGGPESERRGTLRHRKECCVCARSKASTDFEEVFFFSTPCGASEEEALVGDLRKGGASVPVDGTSSGKGCVEEGSRRHAAWRLFSPERYHQRWCFSLPRHQSIGGIPLAELRASAVPDPETGELWLLHRKAFSFLADGRTVDASKRVPICRDCRGPLARLHPSMPKFALANDLWMGRMPEAMAELSEGARLLLPLARAIIKRYNCKTEGSRWRDPSQLVKAFTGNVCAVPQASSGTLHTAVPPSERALQESLLLVLTGWEEDLAKGYQKELGVPVAAFRRAHEYLRRCNKAYAESYWDQEGGPRRLSCEDQPLGLPHVLARCLRRQDPRQGESDRVRQEGPAEAVGGRESAACGLSGQGRAEAGGDGGVRLDGSSEEAAGEAASPTGGSEALSVEEASATLEQLLAWREEHEGKMPRAANRSGDVELPADSTEFSLPILAQYQEAIQSGLKTVEARVLVDDVAGVAKGDVLLLGRVRAKVTRVDVFRGHQCNVRAMLGELGVEAALPDCGSLEAGVRTYHAIPGFQRGAAKHGVVAFTLEVLPARGEAPPLEELRLAAQVDRLVQALDRDASAFPPELRETARSLVLGLDAVERDEWVACVADDDSQVDGHKQFARVTEQLRRTLQRHAQNRQHEQDVQDDARAGQGHKGYKSVGGREGIEEAAGRLVSEAQKVEPGLAQRDVAAAAASSSRRVPVPGLCRQAARLQHNAAGRPCWVVPRAGLPLSMFEQSFWTSVDPLSFPYGDGVFGISRDAAITYEEWVRYLLERVELEYECGVPWWDREPCSVPDCAPAAQEARRAGNTSYGQGPTLKPRTGTTRRLWAPILAARSYCRTVRRPLRRATMRFGRSPTPRSACAACPRGGRRTTAEGMPCRCKGARTRQSLLSQSLTVSIRGELRLGRLCTPASSEDVRSCKLATPWSLQLHRWRISGSV